MKCNFVTFPQVLSYFKIKNFYKTCMLQNSFFQGLKYSDVSSQIKLIWITVASFLLPLVSGLLGPRSCGACLRLRLVRVLCPVTACRLLGAWASAGAAPRPVAPRHVRSSRVRTRTRVSCPGRWILCPQTTEEALSFLRKLLGPHCRAVALCLVADFPVTCPWVGRRSQREGPTPGPGPGLGLDGQGVAHQSSGLKVPTGGRRAHPCQGSRAGRGTSSCCRTRARPGSFTPQCRGRLFVLRLRCLTRTHSRPLPGGAEWDWAWSHSALAGGSSLPLAELSPGTA